MKKTKLERYFDQYRKNTVGYNLAYFSPNGRRRMIYADWIASGRLYQLLDVDYDIACRTGLQCAPKVHQGLGTASFVESRCQKRQIP